MEYMDNFYKIPPKTHTKPGLHNCNPTPSQTKLTFASFEPNKNLMTLYRLRDRIMFAKETIIFLMVFFETPMIFANQVYFMANRTRLSNTIFFALTFQKQPGAQHHLFPQLHCAIRDEHHPTPPGDVEPPWEVGKGNSLGRFIGRHVF